jgi:hypothetical protein
MKTILLCCLIMTLAFPSCNQKENLKIEGAWKLVHSTTYTGNTSENNFPGKSEVDLTKIWSGNHWMFVARVKTDTVVKDEYGAGTYTLEGNKYEESIQILEYKGWEGKTIKMTMEMKNDTLFQTYPVDDKGQMEKEWACVEKYVRIKK